MSIVEIPGLQTELSAHSEIELHFTKQEFLKRLAKVRKAMEEQEIEVLFSCDPSNMSWLTGYDGWSFYVYQGVIIGPEGEPKFWGRNMDAKGALRTCYMHPSDIIGYSDDYVMTEERHPMQHLSDLLKETGWDKLNLGVEMDNYYYSARANQVLATSLDSKFIDATNLVNRLRACKSETELKYMRRAARIVEKMHSTVAEHVRPGLRKNELVAEIYRTAISGGQDEEGHFYGDYPAIVPMLPTGKDASAAHLTWDGKVFDAGFGTFFELAGCHKRYHAPLCRTVYLGTPPKEFYKGEEALLEGLEAGINAACPGNTAADVYTAFNNVMIKFGIDRGKTRAGYPVGLSYPPDWGERTFSILPTDHTVLKPNMTFHLMPGLWMDNWGMEITETLRVREAGPAECITDYPRNLIVKE